ncbi:MAG: exodeoxyribonuclease VII small subunit [Deltaproteobacteria bacterium]|nr:exodeoxyribonuclease VII small subunit [Deltaproteobacteria bacterium]
MRKARRWPPLEANAPFEQVAERLEEIVAVLEAGDLPLERSLQAFEEGVALARRAQQSLDAMERRIEVLTREGDLKPLPQESVDDAVEDE